MLVQPIITQQHAYKLLLGLILFEIFLTAVYLVDVFSTAPTQPLYHLVDMDESANLPEWFASCQLFLIGTLLWFISLQHRDSQAPSRRFFLTLAGGFIFLSMDEAAQIHETVARWLHRTDWALSFKGGHGSWIPLYLLGGLLFVLLFYRDMLAIWRGAPRVSFVAAIGICTLLLGSVGIEIISYVFLREEATQLLYRVEVAAEELLEMLGASILLYSVMVYALDEAQRAIRARWILANEDDDYTASPQGKQYQAPVRLHSAEHE